MRDLLSIGQFSRLTGLTVKALRLYDRLGVLPPAVVDLSSGYRYYEAGQAVTAGRIQLLRSLDMPLAEIRGLFGETNPNMLGERLLHHRRLLEERITNYQDGLALLQTLDDWRGAIEKRQMDEPKTGAYVCGFCGREHHAVFRMIAGRNGGLICNECVARCNELLAASSGEPAVDEPDR